ncbi:MAG: hypothetical protein EBU97_02425 [Rhodobacteraceae bacterium]|nr:hypothetical protein [Paracoccaceae bacterium]
MKMIFAMAGAIVLQAGVASAQDVSGYFELSGQSSNYPYFGVSYSPWTGLSGAAAVSYDVGNARVGVELSGFNAGDNYYKGYYNTFGTLAAVHYDTELSGYTVGGYAGLVVHNDYYTEGVDNDALIGARLAYAINDKLSVEGQLGYLSQLTGYAGQGDVGYVNVTAHYQATDALNLKLSLGDLGGDVYDDKFANALTYAVEASYDLPNTGYALFGRYSGYADNSSYSNSNTQTVTVGVRFKFGPNGNKVSRVTDLSALSWLRMY